MLGNFTYSNPTKLYFGKNSFDALSKELSHYGTNVLFMYGGGSIKKTGIYDSVMRVLKECGKTVTELSGVMPNPTLEKLYEGAALAKESRADLILAVGGGSVCDYAKAVSVSAYCTEDPWEKYFIGEKEVDNKIIPIGTILTMVGTGSEMNGGSVITNHKTQRKIGRVFNQSFRFSILSLRSLCRNIKCLQAFSILCRTSSNSIFLETMITHRIILWKDCCVRLSIAVELPRKSRRTTKPAVTSCGFRRGHLIRLLQRESQPIGWCTCSGILSVRIRTQRTV